MAAQLSHRLPTTVTPERYAIRLTPDLTTWTFTGEEQVTIHIHQPVGMIVTNAAELAIDSVSIKDAKGQLLSGNIVLDHDNERACFSFPADLPVGRSELSIKFSGILNDKLHGFYRSTYKGADGKDRPLASTQFESTDARRAFPC